MNEFNLVVEPRSCSCKLKQRKLVSDKSSGPASHVKVAVPVFGNLVPLHFVLPLRRMRNEYLSKANASKVSGCGHATSCECFLLLQWEIWIYRTYIFVWLPNTFLNPIESQLQVEPKLYESVVLRSYRSSRWSTLTLQSKSFFNKNFERLSPAWV